jgi:hypothetical protein
MIDRLLLRIWGRHNSQNAQYGTALSPFSGRLLASPITAVSRPLIDALRRPFQGEKLPSHHGQNHDPKENNQKKDGAHPFPMSDQLGIVGCCQPIRFTLIALFGLHGAPRQREP